ncbi:MAG: lipoate--protein ligase family protein [Candidatus Omnitrophota bacterium]
MKTFRLIRSRPSGASCNMALDERIFSRYLDEGIPVFRVYGWKRPALTYGISQKPDDSLDGPRLARDGIEVVKRITGGGILFHDNEITYSFVCSKADVGEPAGTLVSYREICAFLIRFYDLIGLKASFALESGDFRNRCAPHELCSAAHEKYDIVINGKKIGGNAQKRKRQVVFQHGSIPIGIDWNLARRYIRTLPEDVSAGVTTLREELGSVPEKRVLEEKLIDAFSAEFGVRFTEETGALYETGVAR